MTGSSYILLWVTISAGVCRDWGKPKNPQSM